MQITHDQARRLIQFHADGPLPENEQSLLDDHLAFCRECRGYADSILEVEAILQPLMQKQWSVQTRSFPSRAAVSKRHSGLTRDILMFTRILAMGVICAAFLFNIWQFTQSGGQGANPTSAIVPPVPTPSFQTTSTQATKQNCQQILYAVQPNDTLQSIAIQFSTSSEEIIANNNLADTSQITAMQLKIPVCNTRLPGTPKTITTMFTPLIDTTTSTPMSGPTQ